MTTTNLIARGMIMPKTREYSVRDLNTIIASGAKVGGTAFEPDDCIDRALWGKPILIIDNVEYTPGVYHKTATARATWAAASTSTMTYCGVRHLRDYRGLNSRARSAKGG